MAREIIPVSSFQGISTSEKEGILGAYLFGQSIDHRTDRTKLTILPRTAKVSGTVVTDLILDAARKGTDTYFYGNTGNIYKRTSAEVWTNEHTAGASTGNGIDYFGEDDFLYYTSDKVIGRYGPIGGTPTWADDFLGAQGGVPLNTASLDLESGSSQYATAADSASLSITSDITIEGYFKIESLPAAAAQMILVSKWNESGNQRSYKFDLAAVDAVFGDGGLGALTISANTTQAPTDAACTGTVATYSLSATNASFATGDKILIHQSRGTNAGVWERNEIASYTAGTITTSDPLKNTYTSGAQVIVFPEYTNVTVNSARTWTAKAWTGSVGGILLFLANGTVTVNGTITATGKGFRAGTAVTAGSGVGAIGKQGEGTAGAGDTQSSSANGSGGGGGDHTQSGGSHGSSGGGGGGNAVAGSNGTQGSYPGTVGTGGTQVGSADLTTMELGGGGGSAGAYDGLTGGAGAIGGGIIFFYGATTTLNSGSSIVSGGNDGGAGNNIAMGGGGGGSGGSILVRAQTATLGTNLITAPAGSGGSGQTYGGTGGTGSVGRIHLDYYTSYTGTTTPTLNVTQDNSLVTTTTYQLRLSVSTDGTAANTETLSKTLSTNPATATWYRYAVKWDASASQANFFINGVDQGQATGSKTAIFNGTALAAIGASFDSAGAAEKFFDGKVDDVRIFNDLRTDNELNLYKDVEIAGGTANLQAYWEVDSSTSDTTANANNLTLVGAPSYDATDVPFSSPTARNDLDKELNTSGQTYTLPTAIDEGATHRQSFVPAKDPQKSIEVLVAAKGTQTWTLTVHDAQNRTIKTATAVTGDLPSSGDYEFVFSSVWRPVIGQTYHFHLTVPSGTSTVTTTTLSDLETVDFHTYYQFLVSDAFHPVVHHTEKLNIANERYLATWNGITYTPHKITLPSGFRIRCLGIWREYLVMGVTRGTNIEDYDIGYLFFWDGVKSTYNFYVPIPQGGINSILSGDPLYFVAGYSADFMKYQGGRPIKVRRMPKISTKKFYEIAPHGLAMWRALVHIGMAIDTDDASVEQGVYSYGTLHEEVIETLSFDYPTSLGITTGTGLKIGLVYPLGSTLMIAWQNSTSYGVDAVKPSNNPFATAYYESLITSAGKIWQEKQASVIRGYFKAIVAGDTFQLGYKIDRNSSWTYGTAVSTADVKEARLSLPTKGNRFNEFQTRVILTTTNTASPEFYGYGIEIDELGRERRT